MAHPKARNRLLDLSDLRDPFFNDTIQEMEMLLSRHPDCYLHPGKRWEYPWALQRAGLRGGCRVLDAGCGASIFPVYLGRRRLRTTALDPYLPDNIASPADLPLAYVRGRMQGLPFADRTFDAVFCISVIEHLPADEMLPALHEMARVLKPGGRLVLTTDYAQRAEEPMWYEGPGGPFPVDWNVFDRRRLENLLSAFTGLDVEGQVDLAADWPRIRKEMRRFHGYPYTSVGIAFRKASM